MQQGEQQGRQQALMDIARRLQREGSGLEAIARLTGLPLAVLRKLEQNQDSELN